MGNSFQDQLLKAGLVNKKQLKKAKREDYVDKKKVDKKAASQKISAARQKQIEDEKRIRELNKQKNEEKKKLEKIAQVRQLIETNRIKLDERDSNETYYFAVGKFIKKLYVSEKIKDQLSKGQLAIVVLDDVFQVIPAKAAEQVASRDENYIIAFHDPSEKDTPL